MAYIHHYASVPARLSLYNRCNSNDTYAKSVALTREFAENEILGRLKLKFTKPLLELIDNDKQDDIYLRRFASDGSTVLTHLSFQQRDYTGEKPGALVDSLVVSESEELSAMSAPDSGIMSLRAFEYSPLAEMLADASDTANGDCGEYVYELSPCDDPTDWFASAGVRTVKSLLYMLLTAKKGDEIYVLYPMSQLASQSHGEFAKNMLEYLNCITAVLPAYVRHRITFAVGCMPGDTFKGCMLKVRPLEGFVMPDSRCDAVLLTKDANYVNDIDGYYAVEHELDYLCSFYSNERARRYFADFSYRISSAVPEYRDFDTCRFFDMLRCFACIDDDSMSDMTNNIRRLDNLLCTFFTLRDALNEHERLALYALLMKYAELKAEPSAEILTLLPDAYKSETLPCRALIIRALDGMLSAGISQMRIIAFFDGIAANETEVNKLRIRNALRSITKGKYAPAAAEVYKRLFTADDESDINSELFADLAVPSSGRRLSKNIEVLTHILPTLKPDGFAEMLEVFKTFLSGRSSAAAAYISAISAQYEFLCCDECRAAFDDLMFEIYLKDAQKGAFRIMASVESGNKSLFDKYAKRIFNDRSLHEYIDGTLMSVFGEDIVHIASVGIRLIPIAADTSKLLFKTMISLSVKAINSCRKKQNALDCIEAYNIYSRFFALHPELCDAFDAICQKALFKAITVTLPQLLRSDRTVDDVEHILSEIADIAAVSESNGFADVSSALEIAHCLSAHDGKKAFAKALECDIGKDAAKFVSAHFGTDCTQSCRGREGAEYAVCYHALVALASEGRMNLEIIYNNVARDIARAEYYYDENRRIDADYQKELKKRESYARKHGIPLESAELPARTSIIEPDIDSKQYLPYKQSAALNALIAVLGFCDFISQIPKAHDIALGAYKSQQSDLVRICDAVSSMPGIRLNDIKKLRFADPDITRIIAAHIKTGGFLPSLFGKK